MSSKLLRTGYQSEIDLFLQAFNKKRPQIPDSVRKEVDKHEKLFKKRDNAVDEFQSPIWKEF